MRRKQTDGYDTRLRDALEYGPRPMSVRGLAKAMTAQFPGLRGTSYSGVRHYAEGSVSNPRIDLLQAASETLSVRWKWLAFGTGEMTSGEQLKVEQGDEARRALETESLRNAARDFREALSEEVPRIGEGFGRTVSRIGSVVELLMSHPAFGTRYMMAFLERKEKDGIRIWDMSTDDQRPFQVEAVRCVARAIKGVADSLGVEFDRMSLSELDLFVDAQCTAIAVLLATTGPSSSGGGTVRGAQPRP